MENTGYVALSYQVALERKMDQVANNIANVDTNGFKSSHMLFNEYVVNATKQKPLSMVLDYGNYRNFEPGAFQQTGNTLDVALEGNGFLAVQTPDGQKYSRNGSMSVNQQGQLVTSGGLIVSDTGGKPIIIPPESRDVIISENGTVSTDQGQIGQLKVVRFDKPQQMKPVGNSLYETDQAAIPDATTRVKQGMIEGSNVNAVLEMTDMIEVQRKYESVARLLQSDHDLQTSMIQSFSRI